MNHSEDLREFYITPEYLDRMSKRVGDWEKESIHKQLQLFQKTISDYPEVTDILEAELHKRNLNQLVKHVKNLTKSQLALLLKKYKKTPDYKEIILTELEIRSGVTLLHETQPAQIVSPK